MDTKVKSHSVGQRRAWSEALKRQMVAETLEPGASVSIVARRHDVNTNQLFKWRRELLPKAVPAVVEASTMVPVEMPERPRHERRMDRKGIIEIEFDSGARVSLRSRLRTPKPAPCRSVHQPAEKPWLSHLAPVYVSLLEQVDTCGLSG